MRPNTITLSTSVPPAAIPTIIPVLSPPDPPEAGVVAAVGVAVTGMVLTVGTEVTRVLVYVTIVDAYIPGAVSKEDVRVVTSTAVDWT